MHIHNIKILDKRYTSWVRGRVNTHTSTHTQTHTHMHAYTRYFSQPFHCWTDSGKVILQWMLVVIKCRDVAMAEGGEDMHGMMK